MTTAESWELQLKGKFTQGNFQTNETELNSGLCDVKLYFLFFSPLHNLLFELQVPLIGWKNLGETKPRIIKNESAYSFSDTQIPRNPSLYHFLQVFNVFFFDELLIWANEMLTLVKEVSEVWNFLSAKKLTIRKQIKNESYLMCL